MLDRRKTKSALFSSVWAITVVMAITSCRSANSGLSDENEEVDPIADAQEGEAPEYKADWNIEFVSRKITRFPNNPQIEPKIEINSVLVTKDDEASQRALVDFRTPGLNATPLEKSFAECRSKLLDNFEKSLLPASVDEDQADPQNAAAAKDQRPDPTVEEMGREMLKELDAESVHYRLVIMTSDVEIAQFGPDLTKIVSMLPNDQTRARSCNMADLQLRWVFLKQGQDLPKNDDGSVHWHGLMDFDGISARNPQLNIRALQTAFQASKKYAARRFQAEQDVQNGAGIDNLR